MCAQTAATARSKSGLLRYRWSKVTAHGATDSLRAIIHLRYQAQLMGPLRLPLCFLLVALGLASTFTVSATPGHPVTDPQNDVAFEYVSARSLPFAVIFAR